MPDLSTLLTPAPYHLYTYSTLLGTTLFQSFANGPLAYKALDRPSFRALQTAIFPPYFTFQTAAPLLLALTYPFDTAIPASQFGSNGTRTGLYGWGIRALWNSGETYGAIVPLLVMGISGVVNLVLVGPATTKVMEERMRQEEKDGKKCYEKGEHSAEMQRLNTRFGQLHGVSSLLNLGGLAGMLWYGLHLAGRLGR